MFGFVAADRSALTENQLLRYQGCYCGLCRCIGHTYGLLPRLALNYDMTFLILLLASLYEPDEQTGCGRCMVHPFTEREFQYSPVTDYAAAMNMILAYHKAMDDWLDDRNPSSRILAGMLKKSVENAGKAYPRQQEAIETCMRNLSDLESAGKSDADTAVNAFGDLMAELFVWQEDRWSPLLRQIGHALGRFIYLMDAVLDLPEDRKKGRYNPLTQFDPLFYKPLLTMFMGECTEAFERLPLVQDVDLLHNILYSGVWTRWHAQNGKEAPHV